MTRQAQAVIFDLDGVLVDSEPAKALAHQQTAAHFGSDLPTAFYPRHLGLSREFVANAAIQTLGLAISTGEYHQVFEKHYRSMVVKGLPPVSGALQSITSLSNRGYALAVVTSSPRALALSVLHCIGIPGDFCTIVALEDSVATKPSPAPYLLALSAIRAEPDNAVAIEDTDAGIEAATRAGIPTIGYRHAMATYQNFQGAIAVLDSMAPSAIITTIDHIQKSHSTQNH